MSIAGQRSPKQQATSLSPRPVPASLCDMRYTDIERVPLDEINILNKRKKTCVKKLFQVFIFRSVYENKPT